MCRPLCVIVVAGLACSSGEGPPGDGGPGPVDAGPVWGPEAAADDLASGPDAALEGPGIEPDAGADQTMVLDTAGPGGAFDAAAGDAGPAELDVDMNAFFFGPTPVGCASARAAVLTVSNTGGRSTAALQVALEGAAADRFRVDSDACSGHVLAPAAPCVVEVRFVPKQLASEPLTAELVVKGATGERAATALSGEANVTHFDVFPFLAGYLDFQTVKLGDSSAIQEDTWNNNTDFPATPGEPQFVGTNPADFVVASNGCTGKTIPAHQSCKIGVQFRPGMAGQRSARLTLAAMGACGYSFDDFLTLVGVGE